jgi:hypothetical protein
MGTASHPVCLHGMQRDSFTLLTLLVYKLQSLFGVELGVEKIMIGELGAIED